MQVAIRRRYLFRLHIETLGRCTVAFVPEVVALPSDDFGTQGSIFQLPRLAQRLVEMLVSLVEPTDLPKGISVAAESFGHPITPVLRLVEALHRFFASLKSRTKAASISKQDPQAVGFFSNS